MGLKLTTVRTGQQAAVDVRMYCPATILSLVSNFYFIYFKYFTYKSVK
jgi:hypothetical protein